MNDKQQRRSAWEQFEKSGSVEAYLRYRALCAQGGAQER